MIEILKVKSKLPKSVNGESTCCQLLRILFHFCSTKIERRLIDDEDFRSEVTKQLFLLSETEPDTCEFFFTIVSSQFYTSPLVSSPIDLFSQKLSEFSYQPKQFRAIANNIVVPLLRQGACSQPLDRYFLVRLLRFDANYSLALTGMPHYTANVMIESRWSSGYGHVPESLMRNCLYIDYMKHCYPRGLQQMCRTAILKHLPKGVERVAAVKSLQLPGCLCDFLLFFRFNY